MQVVAGHLSQQQTKGWARAHWILAALCVALAIPGFCLCKMGAARTEAAWASDLVLLVRIAVAIWRGEPGPWFLYCSTARSPSC
jgi:hypothetical protein